MAQGIPRETAEKAEAEGLISAGKVCKGLKISRRTLGRKIRLKEIEPIIIDDIRFFSPDVLDQFEPGEDQPEDGKDFVLNYTLETLLGQNEHIDKLIRLAHDPAQATIKALLDENASLRKRAQEQEAKVFEVHELYGQLFRDTLAAEVEAEKERARMTMQKDAMAMVQDKLLPAMLESMSAGKFINSFSAEQIEAFIEVGAGTPEQIAMLKKTLADRLKKQQQKGTPDGKRKEASNSGTEGSKKARATEPS